MSQRFSTALAMAAASVVLFGTAASAEPCVSCRLDSSQPCVSPGERFQLTLCLRNDCRDIRFATATVVALLPDGSRVEFGSGTMELIGGSGWQCVDRVIPVPPRAPEGTYTILVTGTSQDEDFGCEMPVEILPECN